jgi:hypothetical protein
MHTKGKPVRDLQVKAFRSSPSPPVLDPSGPSAGKGTPCPLPVPAEEFRLGRRKIKNTHPCGMKMKYGPFPGIVFHRILEDADCSFGFSFSA